MRKQSFSCCLLQEQVNAVWARLRLSDRKRLEGARRRLFRLMELPPDQLKVQEFTQQTASFLNRIVLAQDRSLVPVADSLVCEFPKDLPITEKIPEIQKALRDHQVVIVCGSTGSGKTTQLPKAALKQGFGRTGRIGCTQPRRIAASALAQRLSAELHTAPGQGVGYKVRFDDRTSDKTVVKFMTDGILLAETREDPDLLQYDCIILDEVHERSLNIDFLLGYMKLLLQRRKDLRVIISSATLESSRIAAFFDDAPVIEVEGRLFPVEDCFLEPDKDEELSEAVARGIDFLSDLDSDGDILVFLPGEREIREALDFLEGRRYSRTEILPLFGRLSSTDQARIFQRSTRRRIILSTNVAETSLTIPGIRFVVDSGLVRLSRYNPKSRIQELRIEMISQASARQRRGRCGRLRDGVCVHLYSEEDLANADPYTDPEIQRSSLAGVILQMAALKLPPIQDFPFVDPPGNAHIREGLRALEDLHAIDLKQHLTSVGWTLAEFPLDPHLGKMLLEGKKRQVLPELIAAVSFLSIQDPRERPFEKAAEADASRKEFLDPESDFLTILNLWKATERERHISNSALRRFCIKYFLNFRRMREWSNLAEDLLELFPDFHPEHLSKSLEQEEHSWRKDDIHKSFMSGLPRQLACLNPETKMYQDMNGRSFLLFPGSSLTRLKAPPRWILTFALVETSRVFARNCCVVLPEWLEETAPHICTKHYDSVHWDATSGFVYAREKVMAGQLVIHPGRRRHYGPIHP